MFSLFTYVDYCWAVRELSKFRINQCISKKVLHVPFHLSFINTDVHLDVITIFFSITEKMKGNKDQIANGVIHTFQTPIHIPSPSLQPHSFKYRQTNIKKIICLVISTFFFFCRIISITLQCPNSQKKKKKVICRIKQAMSSPKPHPQSALGNLSVAESPTASSAASGQPLTVSNGHTCPDREKVLSRAYPSLMTK